MFKWLDHLLDRLCAVIGAFIASQIPVFMLQYIHGLSGHIQELKFQVGLMQQAAQATGKTVQEWIAKSMNSVDPDFVKQGEIFQGMLYRYDQFTQAFDAWQNASLFERPFVFIRHVNIDIAKGTYQNFQFGVAFNLEGLVYALIGLVMGFSVYFFITRSIKGFCLLLFKRKQKEESVPLNESPKTV